jgi:acid phosphatase (class A)
MNRKTTFAYGHRVLVAIALLSFVAGPLNAAERYLKQKQLDVIALLPPPPAPDSAEQKAELAMVVEAHRRATQEELARADVEEKKMTFVTFAPSIGKPLDPEQLPKTADLFAQVQKDAENLVDVGKDHWQRPRPYDAAPNDLPHPEKKPKPSFAYPSGHSAQATAMALLLAELYPERQEAILAQGQQIGWDRVMLDRHYESDIVAGRVLGKAIVRQLHANPEFEHDFAEVKKEIQQAKK